MLLASVGDHIGHVFGSRTFVLSFFLIFLALAIFSLLACAPSLADMAPLTLKMYQSLHGARLTCSFALTSTSGVAELVQHGTDFAWIAPYSLAVNC